MRYGVVVCPKCRTAKGVELAAARTKCPRCGKGHAVAKLKAFRETDSPNELPALVAVVQAEVSHAPETARPRPPGEPRPFDPASDTPAEFAAARARSKASTEAKAEAVARGLGETSPRFSEALLLEALRSAGFPEERIPEEVRGLLAKQVLYEPRPGEYALL